LLHACFPSRFDLQTDSERRLAQGGAVPPIAAFKIGLRLARSA
jgi:hypothetical protein